jgi:hypothetical protein
VVRRNGGVWEGACRGHSTRAIRTIHSLHPPPMGRVTDYQIVIDPIPSKLAERVRQLIAEGWQPLGPPFSADQRYLQAMARYDE